MEPLAARRRRILPLLVLWSCLSAAVHGEKVSDLQPGDQAHLLLSTLPTDVTRSETGVGDVRVFPKYLITKNRTMMMMMMMVIIVVIIIIGVDIIYLLYNQVDLFIYLKIKSREQP